MRGFILLMSLLLFPAAAWAQSTPLAATDSTVTITTPAVPPAPVTTVVPQPRLNAEIDVYRVGAIAAGAVAGVVVANVVTGGLITPVLLLGTESAMTVTGAAVATGYMHSAAQAAVTLAGAVGGGYIGNWLYGG